MSEIKLTDAEAQAALDAALATKKAAVGAEEAAAEAKAKAEAEAKAAAAKEAAEAKARKANPIRYIGIELEVGDGTQRVVYYPNASKVNDREVRIDGIGRCEHTREDADGVWVYRHLDRR